jgi:hypothetical protein
MPTNPPAAPDTLTSDLDRVSLEQALRDFEIANARAIDLTQRLVDLSKEVTRLREQVIDAQMQANAARAENDALRASTTFRLVELSTKIRRKLGR